MNPMKQERYIPKTDPNSSSGGNSRRRDLRTKLPQTSLPSNNHTVHNYPDTDTFNTPFDSTT